MLILEDDPGAALLQLRSLERAGFRPLSVATPSEAIALLARERVDIIVVDYRLQGNLTGIDFYQHVKNAGYDVPAIVVTGFTAELTVIQAIRAGVSDFIPKSADYLEYLPHAVARVLDHVHAEERFVESDARFHAFMNHSPAVAWMKNEDGQIIYANRAFEQTFRRTDWLEKTASDLWPDDVARLLRESDLKVMASDCAAEVTEKVPLPDGQWRDWLCYKFPIRDATGRRFLGGMALDITERKRIEDALRQRDEQLRQSQKMEALGTLSGAVAHEFNNLLQAIQGYVSYAKEALRPTDQAYQDLEQAMKACQPAASLTRQLLGFGRRHELQRSQFEANHVLSDLVKMLRPLLDATIELQLDLSKRPMTLDVDAGQLQQVLLNICLNARDAMPSGGRLLLTSGQIEVGEAGFGGINVPQGRYVVITVADTGCGMSQEVKSRIFEPFFTTKAVDKGTGLGLAVAYGIVEQHKGLITVESEVGKGASFRILLPLVEANESAFEESRPRKISGGSETILIAEDEPLILQLAVRVLTAAGYRTLTAIDGEDAMRVFQEHADDISLALLDMTMPKMGGHNLRQNLQLLRPDLPVILCSGYNQTAAQRDLRSDEAVPFLQKPFDRDQLLQMIRQTLDVARASSLATIGA
ncbi:MAG: response regulator [Pirellulales bacterium]